MTRKHTVPKVSLGYFRKKKNKYVFSLAKKMLKDLLKKCFVFVDTAPGDQLSICIADPRDTNRLVYILCRPPSTTKYYCACEVATKEPSEDSYKIIFEQEDLSYQQLLDVVYRHIIERRVPKRRTRTRSPSVR